MMNNTGEDNHQEAFDQTEGVGEPCQTDGASKGLGNYYHLDLFHQNITRGDLLRFVPCVIV